MPADRRESLLAEYDRSGLSGKQFARLSGIKYSTFNWWLQCRRRRAVVPNASCGSDRQQVAWLEAVVQQGVPSGGKGLTLHLPGGVRAELTSSQHIPLAAALLRALEKPC